MLGSLSKKRFRSKTNALGVTIMELPAGLSIMFIGIFMPLLCLVLVTIRYGLFFEAARQATSAACQAQAYSDTASSSSVPTPNQNSPDDNVHNSTTVPGAMTLAQNTATNVAAYFPGVTITPDNVNCYIVVTPLSSTTSGASTIVGPNAALNSPADATVNLYQLRVDVAGQIQPVISLSSDIFGNIPGLTGPIPVKISMMRVFENPQGLYTYSPGSSNPTQ